MYIYIHIFIPFHILFHYGLPQKIEYSSLCYIVGAPLIAQWVKNPPAMQETQERWVQSLGWEYPSGKGNSSLCQYSCQKNPMDRGAWQATVHWLQSRTRLREWACTVGPRCSSTLYIILCLCWSSTPMPSLTSSLPTTHPHCHKSVLYTWLCFCFIDMLICVILRSHI